MLSCILPHAQRSLPYVCCTVQCSLCLMPISLCTSPHGYRPFIIGPWLLCHYTMSIALCSFSLKHSPMNSPPHSMSITPFSLSIVQCSHCPYAYRFFCVSAPMPVVSYPDSPPAHCSISPMKPMFNAPRHYCIRQLENLALFDVCLQAFPIYISSHRP